MAIRLIRRKGIKRKRQRTFRSPSHYFHNYEHDPRGRTHCKSSGQHPYKIEHSSSKHIISNRVAIGHGRGGKSQAFVFKKRLGKGYDLSSGVKVVKAPKR